MVPILFPSLGWTWLTLMNGRGPPPPSLSRVKLSVSSVLVAGGVCPPSHVTIRFCLSLSLCHLGASVLLPQTSLWSIILRFWKGTSSTWTREGNGSPLQYSCLENPMDGGAWWAAVHGVAKSRTGLSDFTFTFHFHALEKEMATHFSILAWRIPGMGAWWAAFYGVEQSWT